MISIRSFQFSFIVFLCATICSNVFAHSSALEHDSSPPKVTYLANEAVLFSAGDKAFLFDPFFHRHFNTYALVPEEMKAAIMAGEPPYDNIDAIFVSHAHGDHFSDTDTLKYLQNHTEVKLYGPKQAIEQVRFLKPKKQVLDRLVAFSLQVGDKPKTFSVDNVVIEAVPLLMPHRHADSTNSALLHVRAAATRRRTSDNVLLVGSVPAAVATSSFDMAMQED